MENKIIGEFLLTLRKEKNLTQSEIAKLCNVSGQAVSKWERGESIPDVEILQRLSLLYDITINELLEGERRIRKDISSKRIISLRIILLTISLLTFFLSFIDAGSLNSTLFNISPTLSGFQLVIKGLSGDVVYVTWIMFILILFQIIYLSLVIAKIFDKDIYFTISMSLANVFLLVITITNFISGLFVVFPQFIIALCGLLLLVLSKKNTNVQIVEHGEVNRKTIKKYKRTLKFYTFVYGVILIIIVFELFQNRHVLLRTELLGFVVASFFILNKYLNTKIVKNVMKIQTAILIIPVISLLFMMDGVGVNVLIPLIISLVIAIIPILVSIRYYKKFI